MRSYYFIYNRDSSNDWWEKKMVIGLQYDAKQIELLRKLIVRLSAGGKGVQKDFEDHFKDTNLIDILLWQYELIRADNEITMDDISLFKQRFLSLYDNELNEDEFVDGHPLLIFNEEIERFRIVLDEIETQLDSLNSDIDNEKTRVELIKKMTSISGLYHHFNRKEKVIFPILERYNFYTLPRTMWKEDDRIRGLYKATVRRFERMSDIDFHLVRETYIRFVNAFREMLQQEELIFQPIISLVFTNDDWLQMANESDAFGFAMGVVQVDTLPTSSEQEPNRVQNKSEFDTEKITKNLPFGGGYLTLKEVDLILNNLPVEITFVDKNGIFKYFNERGKYADMVLVRTPASIGRNVANCHPPKSMKKVMKLIRELKDGKRKSETMWFKKQDYFVHITYKAIFADDGDYMGILECVQDIQPFFNLPQEAKRAVSRM